MEVPADLSKFFDASIVRLDVAVLKKYNPRKFPVFCSMIDKMGKLSSEAQRLKRTLTTYEKLLDSDDQYLYLMWEPGTKPDQSFLIGLLKVGYKRLYLYARSTRLYEARPLCVLDFYVHSSKQRQGYGHRLYDFMLERESVAAAAIAIDKPSDSLLSFLSKHYRLTNPILQTTNFVVYPEFFQIIDSDKDSLNGHEQVKSPDSRKSIPVQKEFANLKNSNRQDPNMVAQASSSPTKDDGGIIARASSDSISNAQMAKGRKIVSMDHQLLW